VIDALLPDMEIEDTVRTTVTGVDFSQALLEGMLGLLLFAGALHVKLSDLQKQWSLILLMATLGVALSTLVFGVGAHLMFGLPLLVALVFGSLISPTDPVAVLGVLRASNLKKNARDQKSQAKAYLMMALAMWCFWFWSAWPFHRIMGMAVGSVMRRSYLYKKPLAVP